MAAGGLKLLCLDPVSTQTTPAELEYIRKFIAPSTIVDVRSLPNGTPTIENARDEAIAAPNVVDECIRAQSEGYDGVFVNCFADPGVHAARECVRIPVFGGFEPAVHLALGMAHKIGIVTVVPSVLTLLSDVVARSRLGGRIVDIRSVGIPVLELSDHERLCRALVTECLHSIRERGSQAIVLGCTAMIGVAESVRAMLLEQGCAVPVLEAAQCAVSLLELYASMGLTHSPLTYIPITY